MLAKGNNHARSGSRAMVETIAVTDGELTALSALSGQQLLTVDNDTLGQLETSPSIEEAVCVTVPCDETMEVDGEEQIASSSIVDTSLIRDVKLDTSTSSTVVVSTNNIIRGTPILVSASGQASPSTSYVVIQSSPGNRVLTTNTAASGKKGPQIPQIIGRVNSSGISPQFQTLVRTIPSSGPPPLVSRGVNLSVAGIRPLNPQAALNQRGQMVTKVLLPRSGGAQQVVTLPVQDGKLGDQQRIIVGGQVRLLSGGMKIATIPGSSSDTRILKSDVEKPTIIQAVSNTSSPQGRPIKVIQARPMGVLTPNKIQQLVPSSPGGKGLIVNKVLPGGGTRVTVLPQGAKSPAKILPAPLNIISSSTSQPSNQSASPQKVIIRQASIKSLPASATHGLRIPTSSQPVLANTSGLQSVQVAGRQMQYVRLVSIPSSTDSTATITNTAIGKGNTVLTLASASGSQTGGSIKMIPVASSSTPKTLVTKTISGQKFIIPASLAMTQIRTSVPSSVMSVVSAASTNTTASAGNIVMLSTAAVQAAKPSVSQSEVDIKPVVVSMCEDENVIDSEAFMPVTKVPLDTGVATTTKQGRSSLPEPNGIKPRKPCNCTKSQCLKLYCDCFANGEFCHQCNCNCCYNNLEHEEDRQRAIRSCLERNPNAFRPKIGKGIIGDGRRHNKGCNCKRSGCLKNYCECYEAKIACSNNCKCVGCRNIEDDIDRRSLRELIEVTDLDSPILASGATKKKSHSQMFDMPTIKQEDFQRRGNRRSDSIMSDHVVSATCRCLVAQAEKAEKDNLKDSEAEKLIIEEFGRCLVEIIACVSNRTEDTSSSVSDQCESL